MINNKKIKLMRDLMFNEAGYNNGYCYCRNARRTEITFKQDFPVAYKKIMNGEITIISQDMK